ncbi:MAG: bifunctional demethylmenaquinone methyltransferase/2-methoxy-6-polyprenyl-1,4-benzoquinol methylase UbiE [Ignavibacteriales bacterium]|nr:MAG: bifunctional demethylmenaquinone methyltransferase/2-methoxy-6-polyprenyl-1,4-benzoquinol methylase UbiE [Ignavibacteriales bacterium]
MQTIPAHSDKKTEVKRIFDSIAGSYDFLNHLLSAGVDFYWRRKALKLTAMGKDAILLDVACGTGDFAIEARKQGVKHIYGADFSGNMLRHFNKKSDWIIGKNVQLAAEHLPFTDAYFTNITVAFGVRNFYDIPMAFKEFARVIKQEGKVTILEFRMPTNPLIRILYNAYFKYILPLIGRMVSKDKSAYTYLPESVEDFDKNVDLVKLLKEAGFKTAVRHNLTFGLVQVVIGVR